MDVRELVNRLAAHVDRHHPRLGSRILRARFGGLRVLEPSRPLGAAVLAAGAVSGVGTAGIVRRATSGRLRASPLALALSGPVVAWGLLWRWDSARWRRRHVVLVLDLPMQVLDLLVEDLGLRGLRVDRWDGPRRAGGASSGISCRLADLRAVNARLDELSRSVAGSAAGRAGS